MPREQKNELRAEPYRYQVKMIYFLSVISGFVGFATLEDAKKNYGKLNPMKFFFAFLAWVGIFHFDLEYLYTSGGIDRLVFFSFVFLGLSPIIGFIIFWKSGQIIKRFLKSALFLLLWGVFSYIGELLPDSKKIAPAAILGLIGTIVCLLPYKKIRKNWSKAKEQRKQQRRLANEEQQRIFKEAELQHQKEQEEQEKAEFMKSVIEELNK